MSVESVTEGSIRLRRSVRVRRILESDEEEDGCIMAKVGSQINDETESKLYEGEKKLLKLDICHQ